MDEHGLLLRHAARWALERGRPFDRDLVEDAVRLRERHDRLSAYRWPAGSVRHLMLTRWPAHGPLDPPDVPRLVAGLDTFWQFLHETGRLSQQSATPASLHAEATEAAEPMLAACLDPALRGVATSLVAFGREIGVTVEGRSDIDEINRRLTTIKEAWNALPEEERRRRSSGADVTAVGVPQAGARFGTADELRPGMPSGTRFDTAPHAGEPSPARFDDPEELVPTDPEALVPSDPAISGPPVRESEFIRTLLALVDWVGDGVDINDDGVPERSVVRKIYLDLGLWSWEHPFRRAWADATDSGETDLQLCEQALNGWESGLDCLPFMRLWLVALESGLIDQKLHRAFARPERMPTYDEEWVELGCQAASVLAETSMHMDCYRPLFGLLLATYFDEDSPPSIAGMQEWFADSPINPGWGLDADSERRRSAAVVTQCVQMFGDLPMWLRIDGRLHPTEFGWDATLVLIAAVDSGVLEA